VITRKNITKRDEQKINRKYFLSLISKKKGENNDSEREKGETPRRDLSE